MVRAFATLLLVATAAVFSQAAPLRQDVYVWQRAWTDSVTDAVQLHGGRFGEVIVLNAEVSWKQGLPSCTKVALNFAALRSMGTEVGLALRIGGFPGPFARDDARANYLARLAGTLVEEARAEGLDLSELQLDFDCAQSKLDGYRLWLATIQDAVSPVPVTITALPAWLNEPSFPKLVELADGYVLQIHSFERPTGSQTIMTLCDPVAGKAAVTKAARIGRPFRVALPTYGYIAAFDEEGILLGLSAEGPAGSWPASARRVEVRANPAELSRLVRDWTESRPAELTGILWYRLPVGGDVRNWRWPTLACVMEGEPPTPQMRVVTERNGAGLAEFTLCNDGTADAERLPGVNVQWQGAHRVAADSVGGYRLVGLAPDRFELRPVEAEHGLPAGDRRKIGWVRLDADTDLTVEIGHEKR